MLLGVLLAATAHGAAAQNATAVHTPAEAVATDQQPSKEQLNKLFEVMRVREQMASMTKMMPALIQQQMQAQIQQMQKDHPEMKPMSEEQQQAFSKVMGKFTERAITLYSSDEMMGDMRDLYGKHLTRSDVDGIIAFYNSPAGQHMLDMVPVIMQEFMPTAMRHMQENMKPLLDDLIKEMDAIVKSPAAEKPAVKN
jgi:hypothetical protein